MAPKLTNAKTGAALFRRLSRNSRAFLDTRESASGRFSGRPCPWSLRWDQPILGPFQAYQRSQPGQHRGKVEVMLVNLTPWLVTLLFSAGMAFSVPGN